MKSGTFSGTKINEITLPKSISYIGENVFMSCPFLKKITINSLHIDIDRNAFAGLRGPITIEVPEEYVGDIDSCRKTYIIDREGNAVPVEHELVRRQKEEGEKNSEGNFGRPERSLAAIVLI